MFPLHSQLDTLVKMSNPAAPKIKYLSKQELERFLSCIENPRDKALFGIIYLYGLRASEATILRLQDIDLKRKKISIRRVKGGIGGERPLFRMAERLLRQYLRTRLCKGDGLFTGRQGGLSRKRVHQLFKGYVQSAGLDPRFTVHSLRHSIATHLLDAGVGIEFVRDHLGHKNIQNTMIYAQLTDRRREEVYRNLEDSDDIAKMG
jgi:integrase/recombinase XerD